MAAVHVLDTLEAIPGKNVVEEEQKVPISERSPAETIEINVFTGGTQTSQSGVTKTFDESELDQVVESYNPGIHIAPLIQGHEEQFTGAPSMGWVKNLFRKGLELFANVDLSGYGKSQLEEGNFRRVSCRFYPPDDNNNPYPGKLSLRHLALVAIPAVKGLAQFSEDMSSGLAYSEELIKAMDYTFTEKEFSYGSAEDREEVQDALLRAMQRLNLDAEEEEEAEDREVQEMEMGEGKQDYQEPLYEGLANVRSRALAREKAKREAKKEKAAERGPVEFKTESPDDELDRLMRRYVGKQVKRRPADTVKEEKELGAGLLNVGDRARSQQRALGLMPKRKVRKPKPTPVVSADPGEDDPFAFGMDKYSESGKTIMIIETDGEDLPSGLIDQLLQGQIPGMLALDGPMDEHEHDCGCEDLPEDMKDDEDKGICMAEEDEDEDDKKDKKEKKKAKGVNVRIELDEEDYDLVGKDTSSLHMGKASSYDEKDEKYEDDERYDSTPDSYQSRKEKAQNSYDDDPDGPKRQKGYQKIVDGYVKDKKSNTVSGMNQKKKRNHLTDNMIKAYSYDRTQEYTPAANFAEGIYRDDADYSAKRLQKDIGAQEYEKYTEETELEEEEKEKKKKKASVVLPEPRPKKVAKEKKKKEEHSYAESLHNQLTEYEAQDQKRVWKDYAEGLYVSGVLTESIVKQEDLVNALITLDNQSSDLSFSERQVNPLNTVTSILSSLQPIVGLSGYDPDVDPVKSANEMFLEPLPDASSSALVYSEANKDIAFSADSYHLHQRATKLAEVEGIDYYNAVRKLIS